MTMINRIMKPVIRFEKFSTKQMQVFTWWCKSSPYKDHNGIIADGSIRAGKTVSMAVSFIIWAMDTFDRQNFTMCGKTVGAFRRNVWKWLKPVLLLHGFGVEESRTENLATIRKGDSENYFYIFGGRDESSQDLIQGITSAGTFLDEVALMPESFVNQATGRCSVEGAKLWFNCNPESPLHWFLKNWIEKATDKKLLHLHFLMDDNLSLSEDTRQRYRSMYSGVFFQRFIQGLWVIAEGAIYKDAWDDEYNLFGDEKLEWIRLNKDSMRRYIAIDYGTVNPMVFLDIYDDGDVAWVTREYYYDSRAVGKEKDNSQYAEDLEEFVKSGFKNPLFIIIDPSAASFKVELRIRGMRSKETPETINADNSVLEGIRHVSTMLTKRKLKFHKANCQNTIKEMKSYVWDDKAQQKSGKEKPLKVNDHGPDAIRYFVNTIIPVRRLANAS